jgi:hypothetical protein
MPKCYKNFDTQCRCEPLKPKLTHCIYAVWKAKGKGARIALYSYGIRAGWPSNCSSILGRVEIFLFSTGSRLTMGPTQPLIQWVLGTLLPGVKWEGCEADHLHLVPRSRMVRLYLHSPIHPHGMVPK